MSIVRGITFNIRQHQKRFFHNSRFFFKNTPNNVTMEQPVTAATKKMKITNAFPDGLQYIIPESLVHTSGAKWEYQPDATLKQILQKEFKEHHKNFLLGNITNTTIPIYYFISGDGIGKSRNASEFHGSLITCFSENQDDAELLSKIKNALVFHVSYDDETSLKPGEDPYLAIGTRMLSQLLSEKMGFNEVYDKYEPPLPLNVLSLVAKHQNRNLNDIMVILVVDNMHKLINNNDYDDHDPFHNILSAIANLGSDKIFLVPCCTSSSTPPVESFKPHKKHKKPVYLPVPLLSSPMYCPFPINRTYREWKKRN